MAGLFVTFEGVEGAGKTTQIELLVARLREAGHGLTVTREPGGTAVGEEIREMLLSRKTEKLDPLAELLLFEADRAQHVATVVLPALERGEVVICDRFYDASTAYQGAARGVDVDTVQALNLKAAHGLVPDLTILLDTDPANVQDRIERRFDVEGTDQARFDLERIEFHRAVRKGYLALAEAEKERFRVVAADRPVEVVFDDVFAHVQAALEKS